ncbi:MAG: aminotransferase class V-fold PLP-dependent enzyme, partial [Gammaproteobacteria bacterium]
TQPIASAVGLGAAIDYLNQLNLNDLWQHEKNLLTYAKDKLKKINGIKIIGDPKEQISIISFVMENIHPHDVGTILNNYGIAIRTGHLCTMPIMDFYEISAVNRVSFSFYNTFEEIDQLYAGLLEVKKIFKQK